MSKYTTEVRFICESFSGLSDKSVNDYIKGSWNKIFDFDFPIWDESYREVLCTKILKHYYTREIGLETVGLWKLKLETKMNEIMPYYNERYISTTYKYNPLFDVDYTRTTKGVDDGSSKMDENSGRVGNNHRVDSYSGNQSNSSTGKNVNRFSDTPQGGLVGVEDNEYLTTATIDDSTVNGVIVDTNARNISDEIHETNVSGREGNFTTTKDYVEHVAGKMPGFSYGKAIQEYRDNLINIDYEIIEELSDLFMLLW